MPFSADKLWHMLGYSNSVHEASWGEAKKDIPAGQRIGEVKILFKRIDIKDVERVGMTEGMGVLDLRVADIVDIKPHPHADKLYLIQVDIGGERRQLVAGLRPYYTEDELKQRQLVVVCNLKPAKLRGEISQGMLLAADDGKGTVAVLTPESRVPSGAKIKGCSGREQIDINTFLQLDLRIAEVKEDTADIGDRKVPCACKEGNIAVYVSPRGVTALLTESNIAIVPDRPVIAGSKVR